MKRFFFFLSVSAITFASCSKSSGNDCPYSESAAVAPTTEITNLQAYVNSANPSALQHPSGFFYQIVAAGTGPVTPNVCSTISFTYTGQLTNGTKFDESLTPVTFLLGQLIVGWQKGLPLIRKGGKIILYIPPSLGYGNRDVRDNNGNIAIPANSNLVFTIELTDVR